MFKGLVTDRIKNSTQALLYTVVFAVCFSACSGQSNHVIVGSTPTSANSASAIQGATTAVSVALFDPQSTNPQPLDEAVAAAAVPIQLGLHIQGIDPANYSLGYTGDIHGLTFVPNGVNIVAQASGYYSFKILLRDKNACAAAYGTQCDISNQAVASAAAYDFAAPFFLQVIDPATIAVNQDSLGSGGGLFGDIAAGKGILGTLAKSLGGGLMPSPATTAPVTQYINQPGPHS